MLTRRRFVHSVGIGAGAFIAARGRENAIWSAFEPTLEAVAPGVICLSSNENPLGPGKTVLGDRRDRAGAERQAGKRRPRLRLDPDSPVLHASLHRERQAAGRHHPDL